MFVPLDYMRVSFLSRSSSFVHIIKNIFSWLVRLLFSHLLVKSNDKAYTDMQSFPICMYPEVAVRPFVLAIKYELITAKLKLKSSRL